MFDYMVNHRHDDRIQDTAIKTIRDATIRFASEQ